MFRRTPLGPARLLPAMAALAAIGACSQEGELVVDQGVGITSVLTSCPAVGIPDYTGDVTLFSGSGKTASDLDLTAAMTNLRSNCDDGGEKVYTTATFDVVARRADVRGARTVTLPYFVTVLRAGSAVVSKRVGEVTLTFADGEERAMASGNAASYVDRSASSLPEDIREQITRRRRPGDPEAALDPLADPEVKAAIARTRFEMLLGFQLTEDQLAYNATR
ncbi:hypothetical protein Ga0102493_11238 [Erythrobacter litoralis]|uniref:Lipoprotein n=2 Tax=Erythrobacter litoralis TaxID=39960 RepID=A0A074MET1_9SPHN|nr:hypothetical protein [Erythrobacter litoralis]AOL24381.1 hypothetical protein Ga0102493_11238 [Erythrobacter litoralis]KEO93376.1 hypothetical protein EH32_11715 [Erythrobacter litoralis]